MNGGAPFKFKNYSRVSTDLRARASWMDVLRPLSVKRIGLKCSMDGGLPCQYYQKNLMDGCIEAPVSTDNRPESLYA